MKLGLRVGATEASALLSLVALLIWVYTICTVNIWFVDPEFEFGLFEVLPISFWLGFFLQLIALLIAMENKGAYLFLFQIIVLSLIINVTPSIVEPNIRHIDAWTHLGTTRIVMDTRIALAAHYDWNRVPQTRLQYPGSFIFDAVFLESTGIADTFYFRFSPLILSVCFILSLYSFVTAAFQEVSTQRYGLLMFMLLNSWVQFHNCPQAFGFVLFPLIFALLMRRGTLARSTDRSRMLAILLFIGLVITHAISSFVLISIMVGIWLVRLLVKGRTSDDLVLTVLFCIIWTGWFMYVAYLFFDQTVLDAYRSIMEGSRLASTIYSMESRSSLLPFAVRIVAIAATSFVSLAYVIEAWMRSERFEFYAGWLGACVLLILLDYAVYGEAFDNRYLGFIYMLVPFLVVKFVLRHFKSKNIGRLIIALLAFVFVVNVSTFHLNENTVIVSDSCVHNSLFLSDHYPSQAVLGIDRNIMLGNRLHVWYAYTTNHDFDWIDHSKYLLASNLLLNVNSTITFDRYSMKKFWGGGTGQSSVHDRLYEIYAATTRSNRVYDNGNFESYFVIASIGSEEQ